MSFAFIQNDSLLIPFPRFDKMRISSDCLFTVLRTSSAARRTIAASQQLLGLHISFFKFVSVISWEIYILDIKYFLKPYGSVNCSKLSLRPVLLCQ